MSIEITREFIESITHDDMEFWLTNKFVDPSDLIAKVCWWATAAAEAQKAQAWADGYNDAATMARCYGHTDYWEDEPSNPYRQEVQ